MSRDWWSLGCALAIVLLVTVGGVLPDIDADKSHSVRLVFTVLAVIAACAVFMLAWPVLSLTTSGLLSLATYIGIRDIASLICRTVTCHRASWHSLLAVVAVSACTMAFSFRFISESATLAWIQGLAIGGGMLLHLLLDECASLDFEGARLKRSFGTAMKPFDFSRPISTALMVAVTLVAIPAIPTWPFTTCALCLVTAL